MRTTLLGNRLSRWLTTVLLAVLSYSATQAQSTANYAFTNISTGSLVDMSMGTTDALATGTYRDDVASTVQPIGFPFVFMGTTYTQFSVNSNGQMQLGATAIIGTNTTPTAGLAILAPMGGDNAMQATGRVVYKVLPGTNRTLVVEWTGLVIPYAGSPATGTPTQFQVVLEENTGRVEYRYGTVYNISTSTTTRAVFISAGTTAGKIGTVTNLVTTPAYDATVTSPTTTTFPANQAVPVLSSTADGSRTVFAFTPTTPAPAAPTVAFSAVTQTSLTVNITDNSTNEYTFAVFRSTDNITFTLLGSVTTSSTTGTGSTVTFAQTGLTNATQYYYRVAANSEGLASTTSATITTPAAVAICGTKSVGPTAGADYPTLTAAFAAITNNGLCGPLVLELQAAYVSTTETFPLTYSYAGTTATNTVTVRPAAGATGLSITGTAAGAVMNIAGGKYLIIDGRPGGSGATVSGAAATTDLTIASTSTTGIPLQFTSDATFNTVQHCQIKGVGTVDFSYPDVNFTGTATTGNSDNVVQYNNIGDGASTPTALIYCGNTLNARNTITGNNLFNFFNAGSASYGIELNQAANGWVITGNSIYQTAARTPTSAYTTYAIYVNSGNGHTVSGNFIGGAAANAGGTAWTVGGTVASRFIGIYLATATGTATSVQGNTVANFSWASSSGAATTYGIWSGMYIVGGDANVGTTTGNTIGTAAGPVSVSTSTTGGYSFGISVNSSGTVNVVGNTISNITGVGSTATIASNVAGIFTGTSGTANTFSRNKIYGLVASSGGASISTGFFLNGSALNNVNNNLIGDLTAPASTSLVAVSGITIAGGTTHNVYYNTINLAGTSTGATFGTSGIYLNSTSATLDLRNNIVVNKSTAVGTGGYVAAFRRVSGTAGTVPANYATTSNNNALYAGVPSATNLIYVEGTTTATNAQQTLAAYKAFMTNRDQQSVTEDVPFASTTGTAANYLHISATTPTQVESAGAPIAGVTTDYDGDTRNATTPDIGADEGTFQGLDVTPPSIIYTALGNTSSTASRTITATITDPSGVATGAGAPRIYYKLSTATTYFSAVATSVSGSTYTFTIDYANIGGTPAGGSTVQYYIAAQDANASNNSGTNPNGGSGINPPGSTPPATPNSYQVLAVLNGTYYVGTGTTCGTPTYATLTAAVADYNSKGLAGPVTFQLVDNTYAGETYPITIAANQDASATNSLTIRPCPSATPSFTGSNAGPLLVLSGASYVTLDGSNAATTTQNWTLSNTSTSTSAALVQLTSNATGTPAGNNTVRNLILTGAPSTTTFTSAYGVQLLTASPATTGASNNTVSNNAITRVQTGIAATGLSTTVRNTNTTITNNQIGSATTANGFGGGTAIGIGVTNQNTLTITGNVVRNPVIVAAGAPSVVSTNGATAAAATSLITTATVIGIDLTSNITTATVSNNTVRDLLTSGSSGSGSPLAGIRLGTAVTAATVNANLITNVKTTATGGYGAYGIYVNTGTATVADVVSNNMVSDLAGSNFSSFTNSSTAGIYLNSTQSGISVVYNSVNIYGSSTYSSGSAITTAALAVESGSTALTVQNNVFSNSLAANNAAGTLNTSARPYAFYSNAPAAAYTVLNNNDYFSSGSQAVDASSAATSVVVYFGGSARYTLADVRTATTQDAASLSGDPQFASNNDLHASAAAINNVGAPIAGITTDFDGQTRSTTTPDIGADEFTPVNIDLAPVALIAPATSSTCYGTAEPVTVSIRNFGAATLNFANNPATITVVVTLPGGTTQTLTGTVSTGTLAPGATQTVTLPTTLNMSAVGTYSFAITATAQGDLNTANDVLNPAPTRTVVAPVAGTLSPATTSICNSGTATLTLAGFANGSIQYQSSSSATGPFTNVSGATSAAFTTPVLTTTTYYRAQVTCGANVATSNVSTITVNTPVVASVSPTQTICAGSTATITATASAGSNVRFFTAATGGTALTTTTAGTYTTPALTASTTYYAEAFTGGQENVGKPSTNGADGSNTNGGLYFTTTGPVTIANVTVYQTAGATAGTATIYLLTGSTTSTTAPVATYTATLPANTSGAILATVVPLNFNVPASGSYTLYLGASTTALIRDFGTTPIPVTAFPYTSPSGAVTITNGTLAGYYYFFYNWQIGNECIGAAARTAIQVNVTQPATAGFSYPTTAVCAGTATTLTPTLATGATAGTYSLPAATGLTINATTGVVTVAATAVAGTYTVTNTVPASGPCGPVTSTATFTVSPQTTATFSYAGSPYCTTAAAVTPTITGTAGGTFSSTTGLTLDATTGVITPGTSTPGTYVVTYTVAGTCGSSSTQTVTITAPATAGFSYVGGPFCVSGTTNPTVTLATGATAGTFTASPAGLTIAANGTITLSTSTPGTYTVTNTVAASGGCAAVTSTATVTINAAPTAGFSYPTTTLCAGTAGTFTPTLATGATAGTFTLPTTTGVTINPTTGVVTVAATATAGTYTVTNTVAASGGCAAVTSTATITVAPTPATPTIAVTGTPATGITLTSSATTGNQFYLNGVLIAGATGQTLLVNSGTKNGTYTVVATNANGCSSAVSAPVTVTVTATASAAAGTSLTVYPNPTRDGLLTLELSGYQQAVQLSIVNALGQKVYESTVTGNGLTQKQALNLSGMATGVYLLQVRTASGGVEVRRIVRE